jgi:hypothetical protein
MMDYGICLCWLSIYNLRVNEVIQFKNKIYISYCHTYFWNGVPSRISSRAVARVIDCRRLATGMKGLKAISRWLWDLMYLKMAPSGRNMQKRKNVWYSCTTNCAEGNKNKTFIHNMTLKYSISNIRAINFYLYIFKSLIILALLCTEILRNWHTH